MCNQTVGLVQREIESHGISTVGISIVRKISESVKPPRTFCLRYPFGHAMGEPFNEEQQATIFKGCLNLLESCREPGTIIDAPYLWRRHKFG